MNSPKAPWTISVQTNRGVFCLLVTPKGLYEVRFPGRTSQRGQAFTDCLSPLLRPMTDRVWSKVRGMFAAYFRNPAAKVNLKLDLSTCTEFEKDVYRALRRVPAGKVLRYGELAKRAGYPGAARAVGNAMKKNRLPIVIPCHRVVPAGGGIGQYSAGVRWKRFLLEHESFNVR